MASMVFGSGNITERKAHLTDYDRGFDSFNCGMQYNTLWSKRTQEGWRSAMRKEISFGMALEADNKDASGSIARLANVGVALSSKVKLIEYTVQ